LLFTILFVFAQRQASVWYFGNKAGLDFKQSPPQALYDAGLSSLEGCATISDANGQILFYTNGVSVNNKMHKLMKNGSGLMGDLSSTSNAVIVPLPGSGNIYYLFTVGAQRQPDKGFRYNIIDMNGDSGLGEVTQKNILIEDQSFEKLAAIHHCNKSDVWITIRKWGADEYHTYLVSNSGISASPLVSNASYTATNPIGALKFAANGKKLAAVYSFENNEIELMDFDNTSGLLTNPVHFKPEPGVPDPDIADSRAYGAEFSPNGNLLYISSNNSDTGPSTIYQFDITSVNVPAILASKQVIAQIFPWVTGAMQVGPDQKIYMAMGRDTAVSVIENPDLPGAACNFQYNKIPVKGNNNSFVQFGFPNFIQSYFDPKSFYDFTRSGKCTDLQVKFTLNKTTGIDSVKWNFGDTQSSTLLSPSNNYTKGGYYTVNLTVYKNDCSGVLFETISHKIWIADSSNFLAADIGTCSLADLEIGINEISEANYLWNTGEGTNKINTKGFGLYWLKINQNGCSISDTFSLFEKPKPVAKITGNHEVCINKGIVLKAADPSVVSYLWNTGESTSNISVFSAGTYSIQVAGNSCVASDTVIVQWGDCEAFIPSAFTPNNDKLNDGFGVASGFATNNFHMQIFDRWGNTVFVSTNNTSKWDGTQKGKPMPNGAYSWYISYTDTKLRKIFLQGTVMLIR
jgi:gliding motility-associated-like protein